LRKIVIGIALISGITLSGSLGAVETDTALQGAVAERKADRIVIVKSERRLSLLRGDDPVRHYRIALGGAPDGHKQREGDQRTPEGEYFIDLRNPDSAYHLALRISYPNDKDRLRAWLDGYDPGGQIMIHGLRNGFDWIGERHALDDWTDGCIAVTNAEMEEIWSLVDIGTPVEILP
jgi:murein L,D-transpeptidase YafK